MERLLKSSGRRRDEQRYQTRPAAQIITRTSVSPTNRGDGAVRCEFALAMKPGASFDFYQFSGEATLGKMNQKELLHDLNDRFAGFIEKVHHLEEQNRTLEREIEEIRLKAKASPTLSKEYDAELWDLRRQMQEMAAQKHQVKINHQNLMDEFNILREKCEQEVRGRADAEESISVLKKYISAAYLAKQEMERKANTLVDEIGFLKKNHEAEVQEIMAQMQETRLSAEVSGLARGDITAALRDIRMQLEGQAVCDIRSADQQFHTHMANLTKAAELNREALKGTKAQIDEFRRQLQSKSIELDSAKGTREALEKQLYDLEQRHKAEIHHYQDTIRELEHELKNTKYDMSSHVQEYQDLLNVKMALDAEIYSYRKLLEGEESRYSTFSDAHISVPYIYRQSPIYTLPCVTRQGGATRKAEPQYKFVEEIITETTSEDIEISDTGSEDVDGIEEADRSEKVCSEEEGVVNAEEGNAPLEAGDAQAPATESKQDSLEMQQEDNKGKQMEEEKSVVKTEDAPVVINEADMDCKPTQSEIPASELTGKKEEDNVTTKNGDQESETKEAAIESTTDEPQADTTSNEKKTHHIEEDKQEPERKIDEDNVKPKPVEQEATPAATTESKEMTPPVKEPEPGAKQDSAQKSEDKTVTEETELALEFKYAFTANTTEKDSESSEVKPVETDTSTADTQLVSEKAEADQDRFPKEDSKAKPEDSTETPEHIAPKAESTKDKVEDAQKDLEKEMLPGDANKEAQAKTKEKETKSDDQVEETVDSKPAAKTETKKAEEEESGKPKDGQKVQDNVSKSAEAKTSETKESNIKDTVDSAQNNKEESEKPKEEEKVLVPVQKEQRKVIEEQEKIEDKSQKVAASEKEKVVASVKTEQKEVTESTGKQIEEFQKDKPLKDEEKETKSEEKTEKQEMKASKLETFEVVAATQPKEQKTDSKTSKDVQLEPSTPKPSPKKEESKDEAKVDKDIQKAKDSQSVESDKTQTSLLKEELSKVDNTATKGPGKDETSLIDSNKLDQHIEPAPKTSEKEQDKELKAAITDAKGDKEQTKDIEVAKAAENGVTA